MRTAQTLQQGAHAAVYGAKALGRGAWCFVDEGMTQAAHERLAMEARLREIGEKRYVIHTLHPLTMHRYPGIDRDVVAALDGFVNFAKLYLPERLTDRVAV